MQSDLGLSRKALRRDEIGAPRWDGGVVSVNHSKEAPKMSLSKPRPGWISGTAALLVAIVAAGLSACGGGSGDGSTTTIAKADLVKRGDAVCSKFEAQLAKVEAPRFDPANPTQAQLPAAASAYGQLVPIERAQSQALHSLGEPDADAATYRQALAALDAGIEAEATAVEAGQRGDLATFKRAIATSNPRFAEAGKLIQDVGFNACGG
jgi:hypothetical protein